MPETFLILLSGGVMLAVAVARPREVTVQWLRLAGVLALAFAGLSIFFLARRAGVEKRSVWMFGAAAVAILSQLGFAQVLALRVQQICALAAFFMAVVGATLLTAEARTVDARVVALIGLACAGVAAMTGLVLMDMLLGHAYLTAARMTIAPFRRLNFALSLALGARLVLAIAAIILQKTIHPVELFWPRFGLYLITRWFVGLIVPAIFVYMAHDCIKRRSTQSATGILYVTGVLIFIGELIALYLTRETGLPW